MGGGHDWLNPGINRTEHMIEIVTHYPSVMSKQWSDGSEALGASVFTVLLSNILFVVHKLLSYELYNYHINRTGLCYVVAREATLLDIRSRRKIN